MRSDFMGLYLKNLRKVFQNQSRLAISFLLRAGPCQRFSFKPYLERKTMSQAIMDPEEVRRFADELKRFNTDLQERVVSLQARFASLSDSWQDQEHVKFAEEFKQTMKVLKKFVEVSNQHAPYLLRKAQRIEEYLNQR